MMQHAVFLLEEGLILMILGMGFVFSFLCILVFSMMAMSKVVGYLNKIFPEKIVSLEKPLKRQNISDDEALAVAIAVAYKRA